MISFLASLVAIVAAAVQLAVDVLIAIAGAVAIVAFVGAFVGIVLVFGWCIAGVAFEVQAWREGRRMAERPWRR